MTDPRRAGEALFALGLALPLFAGGNTLLALDAVEGIYIFDLVSIIVAWQLFRRKGATEHSARGAALLAYSSLLVLGSWWMGMLVSRPSGPRAFLDAQGIFCGILLFTSLSRHTLAPEAMTRFLRGLLLGALGTVAFSQYQYWIAFPRTAPLAQLAGLPVNILVNANFYNANCYAIFLAAVTVLAADLAIVKRDLLARVAIPVFVVTILLSESRSVIGLLAISAIGLGWIVGWPRAGRGRVATEGLCVLLPAAAGVAAATVDLEELWRVATLGRIAIWRASLAMIRDHWIFGVGLGGFGDFFVSYRVNTYYTRYPHNFLLEIAAELGVVGLAALVGFLGAAFARPVSQLVAAALQPRAEFVSASSLAVCAASAILLVHGLLDIDWHAPANPILLFILLGAAQQLPTPSNDGRDT